MKTKLKSMFVAALTLAASTQKLGINLIRVSVLVIFVWIGGLKFWNYEAESRSLLRKPAVHLTRFRKPAFMRH